MVHSEPHVIIEIVGACGPGKPKMMMWKKLTEKMIVMGGSSRQSTPLKGTPVSS